MTAYDRLTLGVLLLAAGISVVFVLLLEHVLTRRKTGATWRTHLMLFWKAHTLSVIVGGVGLGLLLGWGGHAAYEAIKGGLLRSHVRVAPHGPRMGAGTVHVDLGAYLNPEVDQGNSNSCVVQAATEALEWQWRRAGYPRDLSAWAAYKGIQGDANRGTTFDEVAAYLVRYGVPRTSIYPAGEYGPPLDPETLADAALHRASSWHYVYASAAGGGQAGVDALRSTLARDGLPLVAGFSVYKNWSAAWGQEALPYTYDPYLFDHGTLIYGAVDDPQWAGGGYFLMENSWSNLWGIAGRIKVSYAIVAQTAFGAIEIKADLTYLPRPPATPTPRPVHTKTPTPPTRVPPAHTATPTAHPKSPPPHTATPQPCTPRHFISSRDISLHAWPRLGSRPVAGERKGQRLTGSSCRQTLHWVYLTDGQRRGGWTLKLFLH